MGPCRRRAAMGDVAGSLAAVPRRGSHQLDRAAGGCAEHAVLDDQLAPVRFHRGLDLRAGRRRRRRDDAGATRQPSTAGAGWLRVHVEIATVTTTAAANSTIRGVMVSPMKIAASAKVTKGCSNCICDTRAIPPIASPAFHAKKP